MTETDRVSDLLSADAREWRDRQAAPPPLSDVIAASKANRKRRRTNLLAAASASACVVIIGAGTAIWSGADPSTERSGRQTPAIQGGALGSTTPKDNGSAIGCDVNAPANAASMGVVAAIAYSEENHKWQLTVTNNTSNRVAIDSAVDLVALNDKGKIIGAQRGGPQPISPVETLRTGVSWSRFLTPVATDCSAQLRGGSGPVIPAGTYRFVATMFLNQRYVSSDPVSIMVSTSGHFDKPSR